MEYSSQQVAINSDYLSGDRHSLVVGTTCNYIGRYRSKYFTIAALGSS